MKVEVMFRQTFYFEKINILCMEKQSPRKTHLQKLTRKSFQYIIKENKKNIIYLFIWKKILQRN